MPFNTLHLKGERRGSLYQQLVHSSLKTWPHTRVSISSPWVEPRAALGQELLWAMPYTFFKALSSNRESL